MVASCFGLLLLGTVVTFGLWVTDYVDATSHYALLIVTVFFGLFMAFNIGGNDVANSFGTSVGAGTLTMKQALMVAAVFEVGGAVLAGGGVTETVRSGIVDLEGVELAPMEFAYIMIAALLGAALWLLVATKMGWPYLPRTPLLVASLAQLSRLVSLPAKVAGRWCSGARSDRLSFLGCFPQCWAASLHTCFSARLRLAFCATTSVLMSDSVN